VSNKSRIKDVFTKIKRQFGFLDILVNNAAILYDKNQSIMNADLKLLNKALITNLYGPWLLCQAFIPLMEKNNYSRVVNVSTDASSLYYMEGGTPTYGISKVALNALTRKLASELGRRNE
jgi:NAD(P)-dependent dehydrogenase (short-subunit alcohol dehydrogenase family)